MKGKHKYYVYTLGSPDGTVFYVGKGTGDRISAHEYEAKKDGQSRKCDLIRQIWANGGKVTKEKVYETHVEQDAFIYEWALINLIYGYEHLANFCEGGNGGGARHKSLFKQVCLSVSQITLDKMDASPFHSRASLIQLVLQNADVLAFTNHPEVQRLLSVKPRCTFGLQLPLDLVFRLQDIPAGLRSPLIEFLVLSEIRLQNP